jgi:hypothetical protein
MTMKNKRDSATNRKLLARLALLSVSALVLAALADPRPARSQGEEAPASAPDAAAAPAAESPAPGATPEAAPETPSATASPEAALQAAKAADAAAKALAAPDAPAPSPAGEAPSAAAAGTAPEAELDPDHNLIDWYTLGATVIHRRAAPDYPEQMANLDGKTARVRAFMHPFDDLASMKNFMLMPTPGGCSFCQPASPKMVVLIRQKGDGPFPYISKPIEVEGTLKLWKRDSPDEAHRSFLYVMDDAVAREVDLRALRSSKKTDVASEQALAAVEARKASREAAEAAQAK